jgi:hypothetical protein
MEIKQTVKGTVNWFIDILAERSLSWPADGVSIHSLSVVVGHQPWLFYVCFALLCSFSLHRPTTQHTITTPHAARCIVNCICPASPTASSRLAKRISCPRTRSGSVPFRLVGDGLDRIAGNARPNEVSWTNTLCAKHGRTTART